MDVDIPALTLRAALSGRGQPHWQGALWIGEVWVDAVDSADGNGGEFGMPVRCRLQEADGYSRARLLVRDEVRPLGFVEVGVSDGDVEFSELRDKVAALRAGIRPVFPSPADPDPVRCQQTPAVTVVICTRDRLAMLRSALESVLAVDYPHFEVIVVVNAPTSDATQEYVRGLANTRVRLVVEPSAGLSRARNAGLVAADGDIVAFTDDDVVVDGRWLHGLVGGFAMGTSVSCVSGMVPAGEIRTPAQAYFERRAGWSQSIEARVFDWDNPPDDIPLFPFAVRRYGTGANFAVKREFVLRLGGFDEALGAGAPTGGGEDIDMFFRILRARGQLVHEPAAIAWHSHRSDTEGLLAQTRNYGLGLGAWLAKISSDGEMARLAARTAVRHGLAFARHLRIASEESEPATDLAELLPPDIGSATWRTILKGVWVYRTSRREGRSPEPLRAAALQHANLSHSGPPGQS